MEACCSSIKPYPQLFVSEPKPSCVVLQVDWSVLVPLVLPVAFVLLEVVPSTGLEPVLIQLRCYGLEGRSDTRAYYRKLVAGALSS